jgi:endonuclease III related protein
MAFGKGLSCLVVTKGKSMRQRLMEIFETLLSAFGPRHWWPGDSPLEVMVGAILTQNTSWRNVEKAIGNMKERGVLDMARLAQIDESELAEIIRPAGFYNVKSRRLKAFIADFSRRFDGAVEGAATMSTPALRDYLLSINGIGPETADSILLYALDRPIFVVDAYTRRLLGNHHLYEGSHDYHEVQRFFMDNLAEDTYIFNEFHALIVRLCQQHCKTKPVCAACPLSGI